jgi:tRNA pseudouridine55 synthase
MIVETSKEVQDFNFVDGEILLFDKPMYWTSFDLVKKVRFLASRYSGIKKLKVGHAGTLDPMATGLMIICIGKATKLADSLTLADKEYIATFRLGQTTPSFDQETDVDAEYPTEHITRESVQNVVDQFIGSSMQIPPLFSAKSINGTRAYELARQGSDIQLESKPIVIHEMEILSYNFPVVEVRIKCSKGTYIRAIARDFGLALSSGAYMASLRRIASGNFLIKNAWTFKEFQEKIASLQPPSA